MKKTSTGLDISDPKDNRLMDNLTAILGVKCTFNEGVSVTRLMNKHKDHMQNGFVNYLVIQFGINSIFFLLFLHFAYLNLYPILILFRQNIKIKRVLSQRLPP